MGSIKSAYYRVTGVLARPFVEGIALLAARIALGGIFWRSYRTKVEDGSLLAIDDTQYFLFENEFSGLPLAPEFAVPLTVYAEFAFPLLLAIGLAGRFSAAALGVMALVIQVFVFPNPAHFFGWAITVLALAAILVSRGPGLFSLDALIAKASGGKGLARA